MQIKSLGIFTETSKSSIYSIHIMFCELTFDVKLGKLSLLEASAIDSSSTEYALEFSIVLYADVPITI